jgi:cyclophilin family peptidyl-prolyl cis-trans isomerase
MRYNQRETKNTWKEYMMVLRFPTRVLAGALLIITGLLSVGCGEASAPSPSATTPASTSQSKTEDKIMQWDSPPDMVIDTGKKYMATLETVKGNLVIELFARTVPKTVNNFVFLAREGFYDGTTFHRVIPDFMAQGGDPTGTGTGGPGYKFEDEFTIHTHAAGTLSMANSGANTNGSQFFITYEPTPWLDGKHSVFGQLVEGMGVLRSLTPRDPSTNPQFKGDIITKVTITEE